MLKAKGKYHANNCDPFHVDIQYIFSLPSAVLVSFY